ncbi:solute carrier family 35 member G1-like isoform X2 [Lytechinus pictus]|uniref:solute carrier family 35 member G1-like isoform X2 n=1 Tax=Lytechinus pictus TaxID=7653 RepID=UPI0030BA12C5
MDVHNLPKTERTRSQSEILRHRSSLVISRTLDSQNRTSSDPCLNPNGPFTPSTICNAAYDNFGELDEINNINAENLTSDWSDPLDFESSIKSHSSKSNNESVSTQFDCSINRYKGVTLALLSTIILSFATLTVALLSGRVSSNEVVFAQMFVELLFCLPLAALERVSVIISGKALYLVLFRSIMGSIGTTLAFFAFQVMPIGNAKAIIYTSPVFTGLFSCILLREACPALDILLSALTLSGVLLVIQPPFIFGGEQTSTNILGPIFCLIVAAMVGLVFISLRKIGSYRIHPIVILIYFSSVGMVMSAVLSSALREWVIPRCGRDRILLILTGALQLMAQICLTLALRYEKATTVSLIRTSDVLFTFILDYLFFAIIPNAITISGALLIVGSLVGITLRKWQTEKKALGKASEEQTPKPEHNEGFSGDNESITSSREA